MYRWRMCLVRHPRLTRRSAPKILPAGVLEVLDFAPLLREFYRQVGHR